MKQQHNELGAIERVAALAMIAGNAADGPLALAAQYLRAVIFAQHEQRPHNSGQLYCGICEEVIVGDRSQVRVLDDDTVVCGACCDGAPSDYELL